MLSPPSPQSSQDAPTGYEILKLATKGSASLLGRSDIGSLEVGKCADLFLVDGRRLGLVGATLDPSSLFGTVGLRVPVDYTMVQGRFTVREGRLCLAEEESLAEEARRSFHAYLRRAGVLS